MEGMKDNKGFWDRWAGRYDRLMSGDKDTYVRIVNRMKRKLNRNMDVLELACGTGILSVQLAGNVKMLEPLMRLLFQTPCTLCHRQKRCWRKSGGC